MKLKVIKGLELQYSQPFLQGMVDRMFMGYYRYGNIADTFPHKTDALASMELRLKKYADTGNTEWLMDAANMLMIEFMHPRHPNAHYKATEGDESPGGITTSGINFKESVVSKKFEYKKDGD